MKPGFTVKAEAFVKVAVMAYIGISAGRAAFTHMHDWTMEESPAGTPDWFGWSNAVISELIPLVALLDIRAKRRAGKKLSEAKFAVAVLVVFVVLSLAAQISQAKHTVAGWLIAALPALGFLVVTKMVLTTKPADPEPVSTEKTDSAIDQATPQPPTAAPAPPPTAVTTSPTPPAPVVPATEAPDPLESPDRPAPAPGPVTRPAPAVDVSRLASLRLPDPMVTSLQRHLDGLAAQGKPVTVGEIRTATKLPQNLAENVHQALMNVNGHAHASTAG